MARIDILCVEDNPDFQYFFDRALSKIEMKLNYKIVETGEEAIESLNSSASVKPPRLVFLDINLPNIQGFEVLKQMRANEFLKHLPVIIFSTSEHPNDVNTAFELGANAFVIKPNSFKKIFEIMNDSSKFWLKHNLLVN